jgi:hypothetical protein
MAACALEMYCCTYLAPLQPWFSLHLSGHFDPFTTEKVYFHVYVRYESRFNQCPYPPFLSPLLPRYGHWL